jgi:maleylpyruvate isomerase
MPASLAVRRELFRQGEAFVLGKVAALDDRALGQPCALPGWTRLHLVAHLARNADALGNLLAWARTGVVTPMYTSAEQRAEGIETGARQQPAALRTDLRDASDRLVAAMDALPEAAWQAPVRTARNRPITAEEVPWMRVRETWVHGIDLDAGATFGDVPDTVVDDLLDEVASGLVGRADCRAMVLADADAGASARRTWRVGAGDDPIAVSGPAAELLAWLIGRSDGDALVATGAGGRPPAPPAWL